MDRQLLSIHTRRPPLPSGLIERERLVRWIEQTVHDARIVLVSAPAGSGKSTLIRHINRLIDPTAGEVMIGGIDVVKMDRSALRVFRRHQTAMVFQKFALFPHRNVLENTVYGLEVQGIPRARQVETAMRWIERVGLNGFEKNYPNQLSGGMQQRIAIEPNNPEAHYTVSTYYWDKAYRDFRLKDAEKLDMVVKGIESVDKAIQIKSDYMEAIAYKNLLLRLQANLIKDPARQQALIKEADQLRDKAEEMRKAKSSAS